MGMKKNKIQKQSAAPVGEKDVKSDQGKRAVITDDRFSKMHSDPRFQKVPRNKSKVVVDSRFSAALSSKSFAKSSAPVDKRGKLNKGAAENSLGRYYSLEEEEETEKKKKKKKKEKERSIDTDEEEEDEEEEISDNDLVEGDSSEEEDVDVDMDSDASSSTTDTDDEGSADLDVDDDDEVEVENVPTVEKETHRLAILNMDWTQVKAADLFVMFNTILPKGGQVLSVSVYPSEFGLKRMEEEAIRGPAALFDGEEENKDKDSDAEDDDEIDNEKLRAYERSRLRYYYAVAVCDSVATADYLYKSCDGVEFERSSNILDVRFIPDDMEFKHPPRDQATEAPTGYEGLDFHTRALQHSNVQISWDEDEPHRTKTLKQNFNADQLADMEMKEFLASDESEEEEEDVAEDPSERKKKSLEKYRALLTSGDGDDGSDDDEDDEHQDMEVTFHTGLEGVSKKILEKKNQSDTVWEAYLRKKKEKKHKNKSKNDSSEDESDYSGQASEEEPEDFFEEEPPSKKAKKKAGVNESKDTEKEAVGGASAAELALLLAADDEGKNSMKGYKINRKKIKGKKGKKEPVSEDKLPVVNRDDPRFAALRNNPDFALDPTDPQYLRSATYARDMAKRSQTAQDKLMMKDVPVNEPVNDEEDEHSKSDKSGSKDKHELSLLVKSVRRKSKKLPLPVDEPVNDEEEKHSKSDKSGSKHKQELSLLVKSVKRKSKKLPLPSHSGTLNRSKRA